MKETSRDGTKLGAGPPHAKYVLAYEDHFDGGQLNEADWRYRVGERLGGLNRRENVSLRDSRLVVRFDLEEIEGRPRYTGGGIVSRQLFGYGYYEAKGKLWGACGGLHASFWSMGVDGDGVHAPSSNIILEIDGYEVDSGRPSSIGLNVHYYVGSHRTVGGLKGTLVYDTIDTSEGEFVLGYEWLPNQINWYLNGQLIRQLANPAYYGPQNVWITGLGSEAFDTDIEARRLPGESSWDYFRYYSIDLPGINLVVNPGFEYNANAGFDPNYMRDLAVPVGWRKGGKTPEASSVHMSKAAYEGECVLRHDYAGPYQVFTSAAIPFVPEDRYTLTLKVRSPHGGEHRAEIVCADDSVYMINIPRTEGGLWESVELTQVRVSGGSCTIAFRSEGADGQWLEVDDVRFFQDTDREAHTDLSRFPEERVRPWLPLGEILVDAELPDSGYREIGNWTGSGIPGFVQSSRYAGAGGSATWTPKLTARGRYRVAFYNICYGNRADQARIELCHRDGIETRIISQRGVSGWIELGTFTLQPGDYLRLTAVPGVTDGLLAADTVLFEPAGTAVLRERIGRACLFAEGCSQTLIEGYYERIDARNPEAVPLQEGGVLMVPLKPVAVWLGASTFFSDADTDDMLLFYSDYMIRFQAGSKRMLVRQREIGIEAAPFRRHGHLYVPLPALALAFGRHALVAPDGLAIVTDDGLDRIQGVETEVFRLLRSRLET